MQISRTDLPGKNSVTSLLKRWGSLWANLRPTVNQVVKAIKQRSTILHMTLWIYEHINHKNGTVI